MSILTDVLARIANGQEPIKSGIYHRVSCPVSHNHPSGDKSKGCSVWETPQGNVAVKCFKGCTTEEICTALGISQSELYPPELRRNGKVPTDYYVYRDEDGTPLYRAVVKRPPGGEKKVFFERYDGDKDEWTAKGGIQGIRRVIYNLPEVLQAVRKGETVYIMEGEKDANNLAKWGYTATCNMGGASKNPKNSKWRPEYNEALRGAKIVVVPDNDEPGYAHATSVIAHLLPIAESVQTIDFRDMHEKADFSDWQVFNTREKFADLVEKSPLLQLGTFKELCDFPVYEKPESYRFWYIKQHKNSTNIAIDRERFRRFLALHGYGKYYIDTNAAILVRLQNNIVERTHANKIKDFVISHIEHLEYRLGKEHTRNDVLRAILNGVNVYFAENFLHTLPPLQIRFHRDTPNRARFFFKNGFVEVTQEGTTLRPYDALDTAVWKEHVIPHIITLEESGTLKSICCDYQELNFKQVSGKMYRNKDRTEFLEVISNTEEKERYQIYTRFESLRCATGYMLHGYKDATINKMVVLTEEQINVAGTPEGRTGKGLFCAALEKFFNGPYKPETTYRSSAIMDINGRTHSMEKSFPLQAWTPGTRIISIQDAGPRFPIETWFNATTDNLTIEKKNEPAITVPREEAPKIILTTNYTVRNDSGSAKARLYELEIANYYDHQYTPREDIGRRLFDEWDTKEWNRFYNYMLGCVQKYLIFGLQEPKHANLAERKIQSEIPEEMEEYFAQIELNTTHVRKELYKQFKAENPQFQTIQKHFTRKLMRWIELKGYTLNENIQHSRYNIEFSAPEYQST